MLAVIMAAITMAERDAKLAEFVDLVAKLTGQIERRAEQLGQTTKTRAVRRPDGPGQVRAAEHQASASRIQTQARRAEWPSRLALPPAAHVDPLRAASPLRQPNRDERQGSADRVEFGRSDPAVWRIPISRTLIDALVRQT
jgi:hypothetical protein